MNSAATNSTPRDDIMREIAEQAANVRRTFEAHQKTRKQASSATAAAAHHMASLNRKRKFESDLAHRAAAMGAGPEPDRTWKRNTTDAFHSPIASFTRPEKKRVVSTDAPAYREAAAPSYVSPGYVSPGYVSPGYVSDGNVLRGAPYDIAVSKNDVVCGKGQATSNLVGNRRYKVWIDLHKRAFAKSVDEHHRRRIACSIVDAVATSVPQGRFLSLDIDSGLWYDVGYARAVGITMEALMVETGAIWNQTFVARPRQASPTGAPRTIASRAA